MPGHLGLLTSREKAVAAAAATGATNRAIADELFLSPRTVEHHLASIYRKLGLHGRAELVAFLARERAPRRARTVPTTRYTRGGDVAIAYQVLGDGPIDLVLVQGLVSNLEVLYDDPLYAAWVDELAEHCRLILFDKRGTGLSDPIPRSQPPTLETRMGDLRMVMDAAGSRQAVVLGGSEGSALSILYAATYPERVTGLILYGGWASRLAAAEGGDGRADLDAMEAAWGTGEFLRSITPSADDGGERAARMARIERFGASPGMVRALAELAVQTDVSHLLPSVRVPTMVLHRTDDAGVPVEAGRAMAAAIPSARLVEQPGEDHYPWYGDAGASLRAIVDFLNELADPAMTTTALVTVLAATDPEALRAAGSRIVAEGGRLAQGARGLVAVFEGPVAALRCGRGILGEVAASDGSVGLGVHVGECELVTGCVAGPPLEVAWLLAASAPPGQLLASSVVAELAAGAECSFAQAATIGAVDRQVVAHLVTD